MKGGEGRREEGKGSFESVFPFPSFFESGNCGLGFVGYSTRSLRSVHSAGSRVEGITGPSHQKEGS